MVPVFDQYSYILVKKRNVTLIQSSLNSLKSNIFFFSFYNMNIYVHFNKCRAILSLKRLNGYVYLQSEIERLETESQEIPPEMSIAYLKR